MWCTVWWHSTNALVSSMCEGIKNCEKCHGDAIHACVRTLWFALCWRSSDWWIQLKQMDKWGEGRIQGSTLRGWRSKNVSFFQQMYRECIFRLHMQLVWLHCMSTVCSWSCLWNLQFCHSVINGKSVHITWSLSGSGWPRQGTWF